MTLRGSRALHRPRSAQHPEVTIVGSDALTHVRQLKEADGGGIWLCGGGRLAASLVAELDRLVSKVNPITVGERMPLFDSTFQPRTCRLDSTHIYDLGVVLVEYSQAR